MDDFLGSDYRFSVNGISEERLKYAIKLGCDFPADGYIHDEERGSLIFVRGKDAKDVTLFPVPLDADACAEIALAWVKSQAYPKEPDHDGDNTKGWCLSGYTVGGWDRWSAIVDVKPIWIRFGK